MRTAEILVFSIMALVACGTSASTRSDSDASPAPTDASADAPEASRDSSSATCKAGLAPVPTDEVTCGPTSCKKGELCCLGNPETCAGSCPNLLLPWACDRSAHCPGDKVCCFDAPGLEFRGCPGTALATNTSCVEKSAACRAVVCQTDADCPGKACYAIVVRSGPGGAPRTLGVCH